MNLTAIKHAHVDAMIARGRLVPLRRRPDTKPTSTALLVATCRKCGVTFRYSWKMTWEPDLCKSCDTNNVKPVEGEQKVARLACRPKQKSASALKQKIRAGMRRLVGVEWLTSRMLSDASGANVSACAKRLNELVDLGRAEMRGTRNKREWRVIA